MNARLLAVALAALLLDGAAHSAQCAPQPQTPAVSLTLIPPSPVTDQIVMEIRGAVWNRGKDPQTFELAFYCDEEKPDALLHRTKVSVAAGGAEGATFRWPTANRAAARRILLVARSGSDVRRSERCLEVLAAKSRSTRRISGAWVDLYHHSEAEGRYFNEDLGQMTGPQWRELVRAMHDVQMDLLVITMLFQNYTHYGQHAIERDGYRGKAYYPSRLFPGRMPIACEDPLEEILSEADRHGMHVLPGIGCYAFFDYTPGSLAWHKQVAGEVWQRYGRHPSFYGWYVSGEKDGGLGSAEERRQIVEFFRGFTPYVRRLAPDKPVMLATNCYHLRGAEETYASLLPHLDILCPFAFHRMPGGDLRGEEAAALLQSLCDRAGCHLWMDLETFVFREGAALYPRPVGGLLSDMRRFGNFEKILCYQFPGLMSGPEMSRKPGGRPSLDLYLDYQRFLKEGVSPMEVRHAALNCPVALKAGCDPRYPGGGTGALTDGTRAGPDYLDPAWQGFWQDDLAATIDLGRPVVLAQIDLGCLQQTVGGIFLPESVRYEASADGRDFRELGTVGHKVPIRQEGPLVHRFTIKPAGVEARYVRVLARNVGRIPEWHAGRGQKAWLFADEIEINVQTEKPR